MVDMMVTGVRQGRKVLHAKNAESRPSPSTNILKPFLSGLLARYGPVWTIIAG